MKCIEEKQKRDIKECLLSVFSTRGAVMKRFRQTPFLLMIFSMLPMLLTVFVPDFCYARLKWKSIGLEGEKVGGPEGLGSKLHYTLCLYAEM